MIYKYFCGSAGIKHNKKGNLHLVEVSDPILFATEDNLNYVVVKIDGEFDSVEKIEFVTKAIREDDFYTCVQLHNNGENPIFTHSDDFQYHNILVKIIYGCTVYKVIKKEEL